MTAAADETKVVAISPEAGKANATRAQLARLPAAVHRVREKSLQLLQPLLAKMFEKADDALFELADQATSNQEQGLYFDSMRELRIQRRAIGEQFVTGLDCAFAALLKTETPAAPKPQVEPSLDNLSLVQNDELEELVAVDAMVNRAQQAFAEPLQHLVLRLDNQLPAKVYAGNNPLSPKVLCESFVAPVKALPVDIKVKLLVFKLFDQQLMTQLQPFYQALNDLLVEQGVLPSLQQDLRQQRAVERAQTAQPAQALDAESSQALDSLRGLLANSAPAAAVSTATASREQLLAALGQLQQAGSASSPAALKPLDLQALATQSLKAEPGALERDVINLVKMLFEFILEDRNLAAPIKAQLARLQIPILKVAIADKSFFDRGGHPARRLVNELSTAALGWQENDKRSDRLFQKIESVVDTVVSEYVDNAELFTELLTDFVSFIEKEQRRAKLLEQRTIDAEDGKAKSEWARAQVASTLAELKAGHSLPEVAGQLLDQAWANVMLLAALKEGIDSDVWLDHLHTAEELIWSLSAPLDKDNRYKMLKRVPPLLKKLREGLSSIAFNPYDTSQLFKALEQAHLARLRAPQTESAAGSVSPEQPAARASVEAEAQAVPPQPESAPAAQFDVERSRAREDVERFRQGSWFELDGTDGEPFRCRLAAIIRPAGKYIFVNRAGMKVAEMMFDQLIDAVAERRVHLLDDTMLFDRALESVISSLRQSRGAVN